MRTLLAFLLVLATFCFALGITLPLLRMRRLVLLVEEPSLVAVVTGLWRTSDWPLAILIGLFSLVLPAVKLVYLHVVALGGEPARLHGTLKVLANWSMLDVVLVAIVIFAARTSGLATASSQPGLWFFTASAILTALASALTARLRASPKVEG